MSSIEEFNNQLVSNLTKIDLKDYFKSIHSKFYNTVDISFMDYFLDICNKEDQFCIDHEKLQEYKVINNISTSGDILKCLKRNNLIENIDYWLGHVAQPRLGKHGGNNTSKQYKLTPSAFKLCLIRAKNSRDYANYYLLLEKVFKYYSDYQINYKDKILSIKDDKIDNLLKETKEQSIEIKKQSKEIRELLGYAKESKESNENLTNEVELLSDNINELNFTVDNQNDKIEEIRDEFKDNLDNINPPPNDNDKLHMFTLLQYQDELNTLQIIRSQKKRLSKISTAGKNVLISLTYHPNPIDLFLLIKDKAKEINNIEKKKIRDDYKNGLIDVSTKKNLLVDYNNNPIIDIKYNTIKLNFNKISINEFVDLINKCDNIRRETYIP
jgi:gas vesicle protein